MEFPRLVYRSACNHKQVQNEGELSAALDDRWFATVPEATSGKHNEVDLPVAVVPEATTPAPAPTKKSVVPQPFKKG